MPTPQRSLRIGSVKIVNPSIFRSTVLWPSQAACRPSSGHRFGWGMKGAGATALFASRRYLLKKSGAAVRAYWAAPAHCASFDLRLESFLLTGAPYAGIG